MEVSESFFINKKKYQITRKNNLLGVINDENIKIISNNFLHIENLKNVAFLAQHGPTFLDKTTGKIKLQVFNDNGNPITPIFSKNSVKVLGTFSGDQVKKTILIQNLSNNFGIFDLEGNQITDYIYEAIEFGHPYNNFGSVHAKVNGKWGIIDSCGQILLEFNYDYIGKFPYEDFSDNLIPIIQNGKWGLIDEEYKIIIPVIYTNEWFRQNNSFIKFTDELLLPARHNGKYGYINNKNETKIPFIFEDALNFDNEIAQVTLNGKTGSIDKNGQKYW
jgi:hypothetical protein